MQGMPLRQASQPRLCSCRGRGAHRTPTFTPMRGGSSTWRASSDGLACLEHALAECIHLVHLVAGLCMLRERCWGVQPAVRHPAHDVHLSWSHLSEWSSSLEGILSLASGPILVCVLCISACCDVLPGCPVLLCYYHFDSTSTTDKAAGHA